MHCALQSTVVVVAMGTSCMFQHGNLVHNKIHYGKHLPTMHNFTMSVRLVQTAMLPSSGLYRLLQLSHVTNTLHVPQTHHSHAL